jgi:hypothetical protein
MRELSKGRAKGGCVAAGQVEAAMSFKSGTGVAKQRKQEALF